MKQIATDVHFTLSWVQNLKKNKTNNTNSLKKYTYAI